MANLTTSADIDTFMDSADNSAARANLGAAGLGANTFTGQQILSTAGAASTPPLALTGAMFTGGSSTTTKPQFLIEPTGTASTNWITDGTGLGINMPTGFTGRFAEFFVNGSTKFYVSQTGSITIQGNVIAAGGYVRAGNIYLNTTSNVAEFYNDSCAIVIGAGVSTADLRRGGAYCLQLGTDAAGVSNQHFKACNRITSDGVGANLTVSGGNGRGGAGGSLILATYDTQGANTQGNLQTRLTLNTTGILAFSEAVNMSFGGTTGTKLGTTISDKLAFWNKTPIVQPSLSITAATFTQNTSGIADDSATYGGYTMGQIAAALIDVGILA